MTASPQWDSVVRDLFLAIGLARDAYKSTRRDRTDIDVDRIRRCELEISSFMRRAKACLERPDTVSHAEWRQTVLNLFRSHSLVWEVLWFRYTGIPKLEGGSGLGPPGEEITKYLIAAIEALAASNSDFVSVDWSGREIVRAAAQKIVRT